jgi:hypothetical protein
MSKWTKNLCSQHEFYKLHFKALCSQSIFWKSALDLFFINLEIGHL